MDVITRTVDARGQSCPGPLVTCAGDGAPCTILQLGLNSPITVDGASVKPRRVLGDLLPPEHRLVEREGLLVIACGQLVPRELADLGVAHLDLHFADDAPNQDPSAGATDGADQ